MWVYMHVFVFRPFSCKHPKMLKNGFKLRKIPIFSPKWPLKWVWVSRLGRHPARVQPNLSTPPPPGAFLPVFYYTANVAYEWFVVQQHWKFLVSVMSTQKCHFINIYHRDNWLPYVKVSYPLAWRCTFTTPVMAWYETVHWLWCHD